MLWVMKEHGVWTAAEARIGTVMFAAMLMPVAPRRCQVGATVTVVMVHVYLAVAYAMIVLRPGGFHGV
jgi:hypothetical protein